MRNYIITIENQLETSNIVGISEEVLFYVIKAYYNKETNVKLGGESFSLNRIHKVTIHQFENDDELSSFFDHVKENSLKKRSKTGDYYYDAETVGLFAKDVTMHYLSPENDPKKKSSSHADYTSTESNEILNGIDEIIDRLSKLELGQQIIYDDLKDDLEEVKELVGKTSEKNLRQLILGKLVDAGLGSLTGEVINVIKSVDIKTLL